MESSVLLFKLNTERTKIVLLTYMEWPFSALTNVTSKKTIVKTDVSSVQVWLRNIRDYSFLSRPKVY